MKTKLSILLLLSSLLSGCNVSPEFMDWVFGIKTNTVILSENPIILSTKPATFETKDKAMVVGKRSHVCVSLRGDLPLASREMMDKEYERLMQGVNIIGTVQTIDGKEIQLHSPGQSWSKYGVIVKSDELAACLRVNCPEDSEPKGTVISLIRLATDRELEVKGVYWESTNRWDGIN